RKLEFGDAVHQSEHGHRAALVEDHPAHLVRRLDRNAAGVEGDRFSYNEQWLLALARLRPRTRALDSAGPMLEHDQAWRRAIASRANRKDSAHAQPLQLLLIEHSNIKADLARQLPGDIRQRRRVDLIAGARRDRAREILAIGDNSRAIDGAPQ